MLEPAVNILYLEKIFNKDNNKYEIKEEFENIIESNEISKYTQEIENGPSVYLPKNNIQYDPVKSYYRNMRFLENNRWLNIIENEYTKDYYENLERDNFYDKLPTPRPIPIVNVISVILEQNPNLSQSEAYEIILELGWRT
ncbi:hypothetical protein [Gottschalkia acidurici]|nr:hypothetical protein [Gottschalkia acidurici]